MEKKSIGIIIPGLGNSNKFLEWVVKKMQKPNFYTMIHDAQWRENESEFTPKLEKIKKQIKYFREKNHSVSLIGTSAGGSLALAAFHQMQKDVAAAVTVCACLKEPNSYSFFLKENFRKYPAHKKTVIFFENDIEPKLSREERNRILTIQPLWDSIVPLETMTIKETQNKKIFMGEHITGIASALTIYSKDIVSFIQSRITI